MIMTQAPNRSPKAGAGAEAAQEESSRGGTNTGSSSSAGRRRLLTDYSKKRAVIVSEKSKQDADELPLLGTGSGHGTSTKGFIESMPELGYDDLNDFEIPSHSLATDATPASCTTSGYYSSTNFDNENSMASLGDIFSEQNENEVSQTSAAGNKGMDASESSLSPQDLLLMGDPEEEDQTNNNRSATSVSSKRAKNRRRRRPTKDSEQQQQRLSQSAGEFSLKDMKLDHALKKASKKSGSRNNSASELKFHTSMPMLQPPPRDTKRLYDNSNSSLGYRDNDMEQQDDDNNNHYNDKDGRSMTSLLAGSTTEDLMSEMNQMSLTLGNKRTGGGGGGGRRVPKRVQTAPSNMMKYAGRRSTMGSVSSSALQMNNSGTSLLKDYSVAGSKIQRSCIQRSGSGVEAATRVAAAAAAAAAAATRRGIPSRTKSAELATSTTSRTQTRSRSPSSRRRGGVARTRSGSSSRRTTMGHLGKMVDTLHNSTGNINFNYSEELASSSKDNKSSNKHHHRSHERKTLPKRQHNYSEPMHNSFVTGSRIRRIQAGGCANINNAATNTNTPTSRRERTLSPPRKRMPRKTEST